MQNRYVGDVGDFVKLALLKALAPGRRLGIVWYLVPDEAHNGDGRHIAYLDKPEWRSLDPDLFDCLATIVHNQARSLASLQRLDFLRHCRFVSDPIPALKGCATRPVARAQWLAAAVEALRECDLVFLDPDNGLQPEGFRPRSARAIKCASFDDLRGFRRSERQLIVYHHHTRRKGGHAAEIRFNAARLRAEGFARVDALRANRYSPRVFFLLDASEEIRRRAAAFAEAWGEKWVTWYDDPAGARCDAPRGLPPRPT